MKPLNPIQQATTIIRSLMRDLAVSDHIVQVGEQCFSATGVVRELEGYNIKDGTFYTVGNQLYHRSGKDELLLGTMHDHVVATAIAHAMNERKLHGS
jgi:hypothetical protein